MLLAEPLEVTLRVARVLESLGVDYLVGGSLARAHELELDELFTRLLADAGVDVT